MSLKELLGKVRAVFDAPPLAPVAPVAPADTSNATIYTLIDGTQIAVQQAGDTPAPGDMVTVSGAPAPEGILTLQDGSTITCDATGKITLYTPVGGTPVTTDVPDGDAAKKPPVAGSPAVGAPAIPPKSPVAGVPGKSGYNEDDKAKLVALFDTASGDDLTAVLVTCVKALMQSEFGWQILEQKRLADTNAAINAYQNSLQTLQASSQKFASKEEGVALKALVDKHEATIKAMFELLDKVVELPTAEPRTLTSGKKEDFAAKRGKTEQRFEGIANSLKKVKSEA